MTHTRISLPSDEVHVWLASLNISSRTCASYYDTLLSPDERARADRLRFSHLREAFIAARGLLRILLGRYLDMPPANARFSYNEQGKPQLAPTADASLNDVNLHFNLSHSESLALYAITRIGPVGVDVEHLYPLEDMHHLVARFFSAREQAAFNTLPAHQKPLAFFTCWTRKEAYSKARGEGLTLPLTQFDVSLKPGTPARLLADRQNPDAVSTWSLHDLPPIPGYTAALAIKGTGPIIKMRQIEHPRKARPILTGLRGAPVESLKR